VFHIFGALAEFEREIIKERTKAGLQAASTGKRQKWRTAKGSYSKAGGYAQQVGS
jgi:DNA invertase Pin-like site-specific DNA recombinase